jgi:hypothetical protein
MATVSSEPDTLSLLKRARICTTSSCQRQRADLDPRLAEHALNWSHQVLRPEHRGSVNAFGAEVSVPLDAPAYGRLAGWFGRDPRWSPSPS